MEPSKPPVAPEDQPAATEVLPGGAAPVAQLKLQVLSGRSAGRELALSPGRIVVGKGETSDLVLDDPAISRTHLEVSVLEGRVRLRDLDSTNGSYCGETRFQEIEAGPGTVFRLGKTELRLATAVTAVPSLPPSQSNHFGKLWGNSLAMRQLFALLERVAPTEAAVLMEGETGTGKDLCAHAIHQHSKRADGPMVVVDLAGVQPNLIESELFGHVRGAFTGAVTDRQGAFERADGGTIFLDEIGELAPELQPRLLRALEGRQAKRVGANQYRSFDVRVVAASNRDLQAEIRAGRFREDLYHRIAVVKVTLPALRKRREDIPLLVEKMLEGIGRQATLGPSTLALLAGYDWPGNARELRNLIERVVSLGGAEGGEVPLQLLDLPASTERAAPNAQGLPFKEAKERLVSAFERDYVKDLLERCEGNVSRAAREAGIDRVYLHRLLKKHSLGS